MTGNAATATKIASITNSDIVQLTATQTLTNKTLTSPTITGTGAIAGTFTGDVTGNADTATLASTVSVNTSSSDIDAASPGGSSFSATANIATGSRTFNSANSSNTFNAGINLSSNSIVTITLTSPTRTNAPGSYNSMPIVTNIDDGANTFTITNYSDGAIFVPNLDYSFNFLVIK